MRSKIVHFSGPLQSIVVEEGMAPIGFVRIPPDAAEQIAGHELERRLELGKRRGFGSVKVAVRIGASEWSTSIFPSKEFGWFLPIKKPIRLAQGLAEGDTVEIELELH